ncbi:hypothetical protein [Falsiroseomonas oryzae]|uniref:hypothetical protein n=1 Tax=Falsiroseomonas oryzae TaxID=2766473 RepID=UPI0022EA54FD|nr:hypothetical protein [Roseomonas sp. MO-31]
MHRPTLAVLLTLAAAPALAQDRPPLTPTRDVTVTYRSIGSGVPAGMPPMTISWLAAQGLMRNDMPGMGWVVADPRSGRAFMVMEQARAIMDVPMPPSVEQQMNSPTVTFRREGSATVAGHACTIWLMQDGPNQARSCITAEGVMLRAEGTHQGQTSGIEATQVSFAAQDPARFQRPQGYQPMQVPPGLAPGAAPRQPTR